MSASNGATMERRIRINRPTSTPSHFTKNAQSLHYIGAANVSKARAQSVPLNRLLIFCFMGSAKVYRSC